MPGKWTLSVTGGNSTQVCNNDSRVHMVIWLVVSTPLKNISQLGWFSQYMEKQDSCSKPPISQYSPKDISVINCIGLRHSIPKKLSPHLKIAGRPRSRLHRNPKALNHCGPKRIYLLGKILMIETAKATRIEPQIPPINKDVPCP